MVAAISIGFLALVGAAAAAGWAQWRNQQFLAAIEHTHDVERGLSELSIQIERAAASRRGYLITADPLYRGIHDRAVARLAPVVDAIGRETADNPSQQQRVGRLRERLDRLRALQRRSLALVDAGDRTAAAEMFRTDQSGRITVDIRRLLGDMLREEATLLATRSAAQQRAAGALYAIAAGAGVLLLLVAWGAITAMRRYTADLAASRNQLRSLNENLELAVADRTIDLQRANDEIQRFAYIVSHDLRSPLVNVMGFTAELDSARSRIAAHFDAEAEKEPALATSEAAVAAREDLPEAIGFIRSSTQKMDRLINAILTLSRQGRRTLAPELIDMTALVQEIADSLQHRTAEMGAEIRIEGPLPELVSDRLALEQIFSNLVENAVKYLKPDRPGLVIVRGHADGKRVTYEIEDNGRGIDQRDHERVFDLFRRSGHQDQAGEGIGLAHVRALAYRLGGLVNCDSQLDRGAVFRLSLPQNFESAEGVSQ